jgi:hypothetical protein
VGRRGGGRIGRHWHEIHSYGTPKTPPFISKQSMAKLCSIQPPYGRGEYHSEYS